MKFSSWSYHFELPSILHCQCTQGASPVSDAFSWLDSSSSLRCCEKSSLAGLDILVPLHGTLVSKDSGLEQKAFSDADHSDALKLEKALLELKQFTCDKLVKLDVKETKLHWQSPQQRADHKVVRLGINPMIQPEPEDLPKDNPKLEIAVLRQTIMKAQDLKTKTSANSDHEAFKMRHSMRMLVKDIRLQDSIDVKDNVKGSKSRSQSMKEQAYNKEQRERPRPHELNDKINLIDLMKECHQ
ncbi:hypothetical protein Tco_0850544 [Tanacetum coccineum]